MKNHQLFSVNNKLDITAASIISIYNTHVYNYYRNNLLSEKTDMNCLIITISGEAKIILKSGEEVPVYEKSVFFGQHSFIRALQSDCPHWHFICYWFIPHNLNLPHNKCFIIKDLNKAEEDSESNRIIRLIQMNLESKTKYANAYFCLRLIDYLEKINPLIQKSTELTDRILHYINDRIEEDIHVQDIAEAFHYSEKHIRALFKNTLGISPKQYINKVKLENVCHLLLNTTTPLQDIAERYRFASVSHLVNCFKKKYGITPSKYRTR